MRAGISVWATAIGLAGIWWSSSASASGEERDILMPPLHVHNADGAATFALTEGPVFHETTSAVEDVRVVPVLDTSISLLLWRERATDGLRQSWYAITHNGRNVNRVEETPYDLTLRYANFDPADGQPEIPDGLCARYDDQEYDRDGLYLVQFVTYPLEAFRERVRALGGIIHDYQDHHAYLVRMDPRTREQVCNLPFVRAVVPFHPAYKSAEFLDGGSPPVEPTRYNILVFRPVQESMAIVADRVHAIGGIVDPMPTAGTLMTATLTGEQLIEVLRLPEAAFAGRYAEPTPMVDLALQIGGGAFVHDTLGFTGEGVTVEVMDVGHPSLHVEWPGSIEYPEGFKRHGAWYCGCNHASGVMGLVFATGVRPDAQGFLPGASPDNRIVADRCAVPNANRKVYTQELLNSNLYGAVLQTNSWGSENPTSVYTEVTSALDELLWDPSRELFLLHGAGNVAQMGILQEGMAKNVLTVGGVRHENTLPKADDSFPTGYPHGPTINRCIKPDLVHFMDTVLTTDRLPGCLQVSNLYTEYFGGSSAATAITAGHAGLFFQMWKEGVFAPYGGGEDVFSARPHISTTKAMLINMAAPYPITHISRGKQGWGMADLRRMYDAREHYLIVDETFLLDDDPQTETPDAHEWTYTVEEGMAELRATLVYTDAPGDPWSGSPGGMEPIEGWSILKNDLNLRVFAPGGTAYWGNYGLGNYRPLPAGVYPANWSLAGGWADNRNNVENVFIQNPTPGDWTVRVSLQALVEDGHLETTELDADFALVVTTLPAAL